MLVITLKDAPTNYSYPMPKCAEGKDDMFVGRIRRDDDKTNDAFVRNFEILGKGPAELQQISEISIQQ